MEHRPYRQRSYDDKVLDNRSYASFNSQAHLVHPTEPVPPLPMSPNSADKNFFSPTSPYQRGTHTVYLGSGRKGSTRTVPAGKTPSPEPEKKIATPGPLGLFCVASATLLLSLMNVQARGLTAPNILVGTYFTVGGLGVFVAGLMDFTLGDTLGTTAFCGYGAYFLSLGFLYWPSSNSISAYNSGDLSSAFALLDIVWCIFTVFMFLASLRTTIGLASLLFTLALTFLFLAVGHLLNENPALIKLGGYTGILTAVIEYYVAASALFVAEKAPIRLPDPSLARKTV